MRTQIPSQQSPASRRGFTLIEIMAAVSILAIMVVFMASVFSNSSKIWKIGNKRVESNNTGRAAVEFVARQLSSALIDGRLTLTTAANGNSDSIAFISGAETPQAVTSSIPYYLVRQGMKAAFAVVPTNGVYTLLFHTRPGSAQLRDAYENPTSWGNTEMSSVAFDNSSVIAENVLSFKVYAYDQNFSFRSGYKSWSDGMPSFIDVYLEVLAEEDATRMANGMSDPKQLAAAAHRYHTRVFLTNAQGALRD